MDAVNTEDNTEQAKEVRMEYRRQLSMTNRVKRVVEEGEAKIEALEKIKFDEMTIKDANEVKDELAKLTETYEKEMHEKEEIKRELQELKSLVAGYMTAMKSNEKLDKAGVAGEENKEDKEESKPAEKSKTNEKVDKAGVAGEENKEDREESKPAEKSKVTETVTFQEPVKTAEQEDSSAQPVPNAKRDSLAAPMSAAEKARISSVEMQIELESRKLERERQRKETEELRAAQRELRLMKEKAAKNQAKGLPWHEIGEAELPDWLFSSHIMKLLQIDEEEFDNDQELGAEIRSKVKDYVHMQKTDADALNFKSKLAFFTTMEIHDDVNRRRSNLKKRS